MSLHPEVRIGHVHLTVSDLDRSLAFYRDLLGFEVVSSYGDSAVFLSAGGYHHHIALNTWAGKGAVAPPPGRTGLYHFAILFPNRKELAVILKKLIEAEHPIRGASDHGVSEAIYLEDPDGIGVELYVDRPKEVWKTKNGQIAMQTQALDVKNLLAELDQTSSRNR
jgi:catechol 2,3-dioxygenase